MLVYAHVRMAALRSLSQLLTSLPPPRHRRATAANRARDEATDREKDELTILSELRNTNKLAAKRYLEWLVVGRGLGRCDKEAAGDGESFEELVWNCVEEVLEYAGDENVGRLWRAKGSSVVYAGNTVFVTTGWYTRSLCYSGFVWILAKHLWHDASIFTTSTSPQVGYTVLSIFTIANALTVLVLFLLYDPRLPIKTRSHKDVITSSVSQGR